MNKDIFKPKVFVFHYLITLLQLGIPVLQLYGIELPRIYLMLISHFLALRYEGIRLITPVSVIVTLAIVTGLDVVGLVMAMAMVGL